MQAEAARITSQTHNFPQSTSIFLEAMHNSLQQQQQPRLVHVFLRLYAQPEPYHVAYRHNADLLGMVLVLQLPEHQHLTPQCENI